MLGGGSGHSLSRGLLVLQRRRRPQHGLLRRPSHLQQRYNQLPFLRRCWGAVYTLHQGRRVPTHLDRTGSRVFCASAEAPMTGTCDGEGGGGCRTAAATPRSSLIAPPRPAAPLPPLPPSTLPTLKPKQLPQPADKTRPNEVNTAASGSLDVSGSVGAPLGPSHPNCGGGGACVAAPAPPKTDKVAGPTRSTRPTWATPQFPRPPTASRELRGAVGSHVGHRRRRNASAGSMGSGNVIT